MKNQLRAIVQATHSLDVRGAFNLALTVTALRRRATNVVDLVAPDGEYRPMLAGAHGSMVMRVTQPHRQRLLVGVEADIRDHSAALALVRRMLRVERDLAVFNRAAARIPWLAPLAKRMRGVRPPRYPTLWEACVNASALQQVSLVAASAIVRRLLLQLSPTREIVGITLREFPNAESVLETGDRLAQEVGLSSNKWATLRWVAEAISTRALDEDMLEARNSRDAAMLLQQSPGIGPWTWSFICRSVPTANRDPRTPRSNHIRRVKHMNSRRFAMLSAACAWAITSCGGEPRNADTAAPAGAAATPATTSDSTAMGASQASGQPASSATGTAQPATGKTWDVKMTGDAQGYRFEPATLAIKKGDAVRWTVVSGPPHNVTFWSDSIPQGASAQLQANMPQTMAPLSSPLESTIGATYTASFAGVPAGSYKYYCTPHLAMGMKAQLTVQ